MLERQRRRIVRRWLRLEATLKGRALIVGAIIGAAVVLFALAYAVRAA